MKVIDIVGENYFGKWDKTRTACRGIIIHDTKVLLSYETRNDQWMLPGGGLEDNESEKSVLHTRNCRRNRHGGGYFGMYP